jgi:hypothetical protein
MSFCSRFGFQALEESRSHTLPPRCRPCEHPLHLGEALVEGDTAAAHGNAVEPCSEEPDVVLEELVHRERVALLRQVGPAESLIQLGEELPNLLGRGRYPLDRHLHLRSVRLKAGGPCGV